MGLFVAKLARTIALAALVGVCLTFSNPRPQDEQDLARAFTRDIEFDYLEWMIGATTVKAQAAAAGLPLYLDREQGRLVVADYLQLTQRISRAEEALNEIYADPAITDKDQATALIRDARDRLSARSVALAPLAEAVLQGQISEVLAETGLIILGQPLPPVLYRGTSVPDALVVSPRAQIRQIANISITADLPLEEQASLENEVEAGMDASALVVPIGGVGVYPTMVMRTTDRSWLLSTIAHEWTHNYLQFRPLGLLYDETPELRTMNETTADIVGEEIGQAVVQRFYSGVAMAPSLGLAKLELRYPDPEDLELPPFDFRAEMHRTRVVVDALLASGRITEAEQYMEQRRQDFVRHGFFIRRLNQAYFAFYGAYAESPGGPAGTDPVGPAVLALRAQSPTLASFLNRISWMTSFDQLREVVGQ